MTERVRQLRDWSLTITGRSWERELLWAEGGQEYHHLPLSLQVAETFRHTMRHLPIDIRPGELIVGAVPMSEVPPEMEEDLRRCEEFFQAHSMHRAFWALLSEEERLGLEAHAYTAGFMTGHLTIHNEKVLERGLLDLRREVQERLAALDPTDPASLDRRIFYQAADIALDAALIFAERYADLAEELAADEDDAARAAELEEIARVCRRVPAYPAETFHEALQATWFMHLLVCLEHGEGHHCFCPGRTDQYGYPALRRDLESGRRTRAEALELLECFFLKYAEWGPHTSPQIMIVGGQRADGRDASNELTSLCLEASRELEILHPALALSYHTGTPDALLEQALATLRNGKGFPFIFNDEVIVPGLLDLGVTREDAVQYVPCACVEITVAGRTCPWVASGYHNWGKLMELALHDGIDPATGKQVGPRTGEFTHMASFAELKAAVRAQIRHFVQLEVRSYNLLDKIMGEQFPKPLLSCVVEDCLEQGRDYFAGGARYNFIEPEAVGPANVADSLMAMKKLVFDEPVLDREELLLALSCNFEGFERLRQQLLHAAPKFGNDEEEVDRLLVELVDFWCTEVRQYTNYRGGPYLPGFLCWRMHGDLGRFVGALPDGRRAGEALAADLGPVQGRDRRGPTAVINSVAKTDLRRALGGVVLNLKFLPQQLQGEAGVRKFIDLLRTMFAQGIFEVQINLVDTAVLRDAQVHPERYQGLAVRVGGYSAYFTSLDKTLQDEVIARTTQKV